MEECGKECLKTTNSPHCDFMPKRYGKIVSTKAILDKTTNKCKGRMCSRFGLKARLHLGQVCAS